jgi:pimeloyl-ACP methyl ester carboxylesterase
VDSSRTDGRPADDEQLVSTMPGTVGFVFVHGGGASSGFWDRLLPQLEHPALAVDLPGRAGKPFDPMTFTVDEGVQSIVDDVLAARLAGNLVLVAHSSGGLFTPGIAAELAPRVKHIVLSAASVPPEGGLGLDAMKPSHRARLTAAMDSARRDGWTLRTPPPPADIDAVRGTYGGKPLDDELVAFVTDPSRWVQDSMNFYYQPVSWAAVADVPVTYLMQLQDRAVPPDLQAEMAARLPNARVLEIDTGHAPAITDPELFARVLHDIADHIVT